MTTTATPHPSPHPDDLAHYILPAGVDFWAALDTIVEGLVLDGCSRALAEAWRTLAAATRKDHWLSAEAAPINYRRQLANARAVGVGERRMRAIERALERFGGLTLLMPRNGDRGVRRCPQTGQVLRTFGLCFAPAIARYEELAARVEAHRQETVEREAAREALRQGRRILLQLLQRLETRGTHPDLLAAAKGLWANLPATGCTSREKERFIPSAAELHAMLRDLSAALAEPVAPFDSNEFQQKDSDASESEIRCQYKSTTRPSTFVDVDLPVTSGAAHAAKAGLTPGISPASRREGRGASQHHPPPLPTPPAPRPNRLEKAIAPASPPGLTRGDQESPLPLNLSDRAILDLLSDDFRPYLDGQPPSWPAITRLHAAAQTFHLVLGVSRTVWADAVTTMGPETAALALAVIDRNRFSPTNMTRNPGGLLAALTGRYQSGELNLGRAIRGIQYRARTGQQPKDGPWEPPAPERSGSDSSPGAPSRSAGSWSRVRAGVQIPAAEKPPAPVAPATQEEDQGPGPFPPDADVRYTPWEPFLREVSKGWDINLAAQRFSKFLRKNNIPFDAPDIEDVARRYWAKVPRPQ
ncbi:MAG: replication initiation protein RepC [Gemmatimonadota bacterium]|nr:replication initiation protein RepC [Gemmatimonadota bacterium]